MKTITRIAAALLLSASFSALACQEERVLGESLDSGLGALGSNYTAAEFNPSVPGESLDSGLGELSPSYTAVEFNPVVLGESQDSGLGALGRNYTAAEFVFTPVLGESLDSGLGELGPHYTAAEFMPKYFPHQPLLRRTAAQR